MIDTSRNSPGQFVLPRDWNNGDLWSNHYLDLVDAGRRSEWRWRRKLAIIRLLAFVAVVVTALGAYSLGRAVTKIELQPQLCGERKP